MYLGPCLNFSREEGLRASAIPPPAAATIPMTTAAPPIKRALRRDDSNVLYDASPAGAALGMAITILYLRCSQPQDDHLVYQSPPALTAAKDIYTN